ncbi:MAG TPA: Yip1 family protein [Mobilitalea sp.]|nr:Yip1 family protein [Mobilitalea sp.]
MNQFLKELKYSLFLSTHPMKGFWEIKHEKEGSFRTGMVILGLCIGVTILNNFFNGYLFNTSGGVYYNFANTIATVLVLYLFWCISNWCLTCLNDGEGKFVDILTATAYAMTPYVIIQFILIFLSNFFTLREKAFYEMLNNLSYVWSGGLVFFGSLATHRYSLLKNIVVCIATIIGMAVMAYISLLFFNLLQQMLGFVSILSDEIYLRLIWNS